MTGIWQVGQEIFSPAFLREMLSTHPHFGFMHLNRTGICHRGLKRREQKDEVIVRRDRADLMEKPGYIQDCPPIRALASDQGEPSSDAHCHP
jgi:hypothetical protein